MALLENPMPFRTNAPKSTRWGGFRRLGLFRATTTVFLSAAAAFGFLDVVDPPAAPRRDSPTPGSKGTAAPTQQTRGHDRVPAGKLIGQRLITRISGTRPSRALLRQVRAGHIGGVILFAANIQSTSQVRLLTRALQRAAADGGNPQLLVAVDQEGGVVRRFPRFPPLEPPASIGAAANRVAVASASGYATGKALRRVGVNVDLAPVVDVARPGSFLGTRTFGDNAVQVAQSACAFAGGLRAASVVPTLKHFPGLGLASANPDFGPVKVPEPAERLRLDYAPYRACAGRGLVMVSSASYPLLLGDVPAVLSSKTYKRELPQFRFDGLTISDDLETRAFVAEPDVPVRAAKAGLDLLLHGGSELRARATLRSLRRALGKKQLRRSDLERTYRRIVLWKQQELPPRR
jgi:beta-N-acetylhexosaminidase